MLAQGQIEKEGAFYAEECLPGLSLKEAPQAGMYVDMSIKVWL